MKSTHLTCVFVKGSFQPEITRGTKEKYKFGLIKNKEENIVKQVEIILVCFELLMHIL